MLSKKEARLKVFKERKKYSEEEIRKLSDEVRKKLINLREYKQAERVFTYISYNKEPDTIRIINDLLADGRKAAVPSTTYPGADKRDMKFFLIDNMGSLAKTERGILEPDFSKGKTFSEVVPGENKYINDLIIMPGVAFDVNLNRTGYGGGYYDSWLRMVLNNSKVKDSENAKKSESENNSHIACIALAFEFQIFQMLETEEHDIKPDMILTESRIIKS